MDENILTEESQFKHKEGGWGWVVVVTCGLCFGCITGIDNSYSLIYNEFLKEYNSTSNYVVLSAWIGSATIGFEYIFGIVSAVFIDLYDARKIGSIGAIICSIGLFSSGFITSLPYFFITFGIILGTGEAMLLTSVLSMLPHYFNKRIGLANGLLNLIGALLLSTVPFIVYYSLSLLGLSKTFFIMSGLFMCCGLCAATFTPKLPKNNEGKWYVKVKKSLGLEVFKKPNFVIWCLSGLVGYFGFAMPLLTISHHSTLYFPTENPTIVVSILGASAGVFGLIFAPLGDTKYFSPVNFHILAFFLCSIIIIFFHYVKTFVELCIVMGFYGIVDGLYLSTIVPISCDVSGSSNLANQANGFYLLFLVPPIMIGPSVSGTIYDTYGQYEYSFYIGSAACVIASVFLLIFYPKSILRVIINKIKQKIIERRNLNIIQLDEFKTDEKQINVKTIYVKPKIQSKPNIIKKKFTFKPKQTVKKAFY